MSNWPQHLEWTCLQVPAQPRNWFEWRGSSALQVLCIESEISGGQTPNPCAKAASSILHKIEQSTEEGQESLQCNDSWLFFGVFQNSSQVINDGSHSHQVVQRYPPRWYLSLWQYGPNLRTHTLSGSHHIRKSLYGEQFRNGFPAL